MTRYHGGPGGRSRPLTPRHGATSCPPRVPSPATAEILARLRDRGLHMDAASNRVRLARAADVTRDDVAIVRAHLDEIIVLLRRAGAPAAPLNETSHVVVSRRMTIRIDAAPNPELDAVLRRIAARVVR